MKHIVIDELPAQLWKNGGGITREIAKAAGPRGFAWRLSVADVQREGAFSTFAGLSRILTVIEGEGLELHGPEQVERLSLCQPYHFSGDTPIRSVLRKGPIRDFNVIYDADVVSAQVSALSGPQNDDLAFGESLLLGVLGVSGPFAVNARSATSGTFVEAHEGVLALDLPVDSRVLVLRLVSQAAR